MDGNIGKGGATGNFGRTVTDSSHVVSTGCQDAGGFLRKVIPHIGLPLMDLRNNLDVV
jgi:hypothetical protein